MHTKIHKNEIENQGNKGNVFAFALKICKIQHAESNNAVPKKIGNCITERKL